MKESLRVKDVSSKKEQDGIAVKIKNSEAEKISQKKKFIALAFKEMWADAFMRKSRGLSIAENQEVKQKAPSPYLYLRVLFMYIILLIPALTAFYLFNGYELFPLLFILVLTIIPAVILSFFFEMDTSKRLSMYTILTLFFLSVVLCAVINFISNRFIYQNDGDKISLFGAIAIGLMETVAIVSVGTIIVVKYKITDVITAVLIGAIVGGGFAVVNSVDICFKHAFITTQYAPMLEVVMYNETIVDSFNSVLKVSVAECFFHTINYISVGVVLCGVFVIAKSKDFKEKLTILLFVLLSLAGVVFSTLYVIEFSSSVFMIILRIIMLISSIIAMGQTVKSGLARNVYE